MSVAGGDAQSLEGVVRQVVDMLESHPEAQLNFLGRWIHAVVSWFLISYGYLKFKPLF